MNSQLVRYEAARMALAEANCVDEVKDIRDKAQAMAAYARQAKDTDLVEWATEIKVRAERRAGEMTGEIETQQGRRSTSSHDAKKSKAGILSSLGITPWMANRWEKLAAIPEDKFERAIATAKAETGEVATARLLRLAKAYQKNAEFHEELAEDERAARWRRLRWQFERIGEVLKDLRLPDTPFCDPEEAGRILLGWKGLALFMREKFSYED